MVSKAIGLRLTAHTNKEPHVRILVFILVWYITVWYNLVWHKRATEATGLLLTAHQNQGANMVYGIEYRVYGIEYVVFEAAGLLFIGS